GRPQVSRARDRMPRRRCEPATEAVPSWCDPTHEAAFALRRCRCQVKCRSPPHRPPPPPPPPPRPPPPVPLQVAHRRPRPRRPGDPDRVRPRRIPEPEVLHQTLLREVGRAGRDLPNLEGP